MQQTETFKSVLSKWDENAYKSIDCNAAGEGVEGDLYKETVIIQVD